MVFIKIWGGRMNNESLDELIYKLQTDVTKADHLIGKYDGRLATLFIIIKNQAHDFQRIIQSETQEDLGTQGKYLQLLAVALLGIARCYHVHLNQLLKNSGTDGENGAFTIIQDLEDNFFQNYSLPEQLPQTIHGDPIDWEGEHAQDLAMSYKYIGDTDQAISIHKQAIKTLKDKLHNLSLELPLERSATRSALAVHQVRLGQLMNSQYLIFKGLVNQLRSMPNRRDEARFKALGQIAVSSATNDFRKRINGWRMLNRAYGKFIQR